MKKVFIIIVLALFGVFKAFSQGEPIHSQKEDISPDDTTSIDNFNFFVYPYAFYTPETNFAVGASSISYFRVGKDTVVYPSKIILSGYFTINKQWNISLKPNFYFLQNDLHAQLQLDFSKSIDQFYGIGNDTKFIDSSAYDLKYSNVRLNVDGKLFSDFFSTGLSFSFGNYQPFNTDKNAIFAANDSLLGIKGGRITGFGFDLIFDSRDNLFFPESGFYNQFRYEYYPRFFDNSYNFGTFMTDLRFYSTIFDASIGIIGVQAYADITSGNVPYFMLPKLGGSKRLRGYYEGRYRDKVYFMSQIEYRKQIFNRLIIALFYGMGKVEPSIEKANLADLHSSYGVGLRYVLDVVERLNIRLDVGFTKDGNTGIYFAIEEAF